MSESKGPRKPTDRLPKRKGEKKVELVRFEVDGFEGEFEAPKLTKLPVKVQRKLVSGDFNPLIDVLGEYGEVVDEMESDELEVFMTAWAEASGANLGN